MSGFAFEATGISKSFLSRTGKVVEAVDDISFISNKGEITSLLGPTASGKSTMLRLLAGLDTPDSGNILIEGSKPSALTGKVGYLTQRHTLFPWLRVRENIALPLETGGLSKEKRDAKAGDICSRLGLTDAIDLYPYELSGGMQQRAALGRLIASEAPYWLVDEPFSSLDERTQHALQLLFLDLVKHNGLSVIFVTHSIDEAIYLSDKIVVLTAGPGRVADTFRPEMPRPRDRFSAEYGQAMERVRRSIESVLAP